MRIRSHCQSLNFIGSTEPNALSHSAKSVLKIGKITNDPHPANRSTLKRGTEFKLSAELTSFYASCC